MRVFGKVVDYSDRPKRKLNKFKATITVIKKPSAGPRQVVEVRSTRETLHNHHYQSKFL